MLSNEPNRLRFAPRRIFRIYMQRAENGVDGSYFKCAKGTNAFCVCAGAANGLKGKQAGL